MKKILFVFLITILILIVFAPSVLAETEYTIKPGDTLSGIAKTFYGDWSKWKSIHAANQSLIKNPNIIYPGWKIIIPDINAAKDEKTISRSKNDHTVETVKTTANAAKDEKTISRSKNDHTVETFKTTAYDLSIESCGKAPSHPQYGITYSGKSIAGMTRTQAMTCAVDPKVIPLGSLILVIFEDEEYRQYDGIYQALDIGGGVKGKHIDIFLGDFNSTKESQEVKNFGCVKSKVQILRYGW